jgi:hypothetical protein
VKGLALASIVALLVALEAPARADDPCDNDSPVVCLLSLAMLAQLVPAGAGVETGPAGPSVVVAWPIQVPVPGLFDFDSFYSTPQLVIPVEPQLELAGAPGADPRFRFRFGVRAIWHPWDDGFGVFVGFGSMWERLDERTTALTFSSELGLHLLHGEFERHHASPGIHLTVTLRADFIGGSSGGWRVGTLLGWSIL